jgi:CHAT domain-containing protein
MIGRGLARWTALWGLLALGGAARAQQDCSPLAREEVIDWSARAERAREAGDAGGEARARANLLRERASAAGRDAASLHAELRQLIGTSQALPLPERIDVMIHAARTLEELGGSAGAAEIARAYLAAAELAAQAGDARREAIALGHAGDLYRRNARPADAGSLLRRALFLAAQSDDAVNLFHCQASLARLERQQGHGDAALAGLRQAAVTLRALGPATHALDSGGTTPPAVVLDELVDLLLQHARTLEDFGRRQEVLHEARDVLESLGARELRDYFRDPCLESQERVAGDEIPGVLVVYPIPLADRLELIAGRRGQLSQHVVDVGREQFDAEVAALRRALERRATFGFREHAERVHDWLIRPLEGLLGNAQVLVFVPRGSLRTIPLAALRDRRTGRFLIERIPLAVTPGLTLTQPRPLPRSRAALLAAGISAPQEGFPALARVPDELSAASRAFPGVRLLDAEFSADALEAALARRAFDIVHIASHGEFSTEAGRSFVLTHGGRLGMERLASIIGSTRFRERPVELLALSACQTAAGDERAALGLAGVAVHAGARSALATLWSVHDDSAASLVETFYAELRRPGVSRAAALQRAQLHLLRETPYRHPAYWAPFLLINSWL